MLLFSIGLYAPERRIAVCGVVKVPNAQCGLCPQNGDNAHDYGYDILV